MPASDDHSDLSNGAKEGGSAQEAAPKRRGRPPGSRLDAFREFVGRESDSAVSRRAGVSRETVRQFRLRHGIELAPGVGLGEGAAGADDSAPAAAETPTKVEAKRQVVPALADAPRRRGPRSPIDQHLALLGTMPDSEVARRAGVTPAAVAQYRRNRSIPPFSATGDVGKRRGRPPGVSQPAAEAPTPSVRVEPTPAAQETPRRAPQRTWVFKVTLHRKGADEQFAVVARDVGEAARLAMEGAGAGTEVTAMERQLSILG